jgi:hypothetical protein
MGDRADADQFVVGWAGVPDSEEPSGDLHMHGNVREGRAWIPGPEVLEPEPTAGADQGIVDEDNWCTEVEEGGAEDDPVVVEAEPHNGW